MAKFALSKEGTMQGNLMAMPMYALATIPLIKKVAADVKQIWYASDASAGGSVKRVLKWCQKVQDEGPPYDYYPNPAKTWLLVKEEHLSQAQESFEGSGVNITSRGHQHLEVPIGTRRYIKEVVSNKVREWVVEIEELTSFAVTQPQAAYAALTHGVMEKWNYFTRVIPDIGDLLAPLEKAIRDKLLPTITGRAAISDNERDLLALPLRLGGLRVPRADERAQRQFQTSLGITGPLVFTILGCSDGTLWLSTAPKARLELQQEGSENNN